MFKGLKTLFSGKGKVNGKEVNFAFIEKPKEEALPIFIDEFVKEESKRIDFENGSVIEFKSADGKEKSLGYKNTFSGIIDWSPEEKEIAMKSLEKLSIELPEFENDYKELVFEEKDPVIEKTVKHVSTGKWYVHDFQRADGVCSKALVYVKNLSIGFAKCIGFDFDGSWSDNSFYLPIDNHLIEAEKSYVAKRFKEHDEQLIKRAAYLSKPVYERLHEGYFYGGIRGKRNFYVSKDNQDGTYEAKTFRKDGEIITKTIELDPRSVELGNKEAISFIKSKARRRGFKARDIKFNEGCLYVSGYPVWERGEWYMRAISRKEAGIILDAIVL